MLLVGSNPGVGVDKVGVADSLHQELIHQQQVKTTYQLFIKGFLNLL